MSAIVVICGSLLAAIVIVTGAFAWGWNAWLRRQPACTNCRNAGSLGAEEAIIAADLRERIRKLEAVASVIDV